MTSIPAEKDYNFPVSNYSRSELVAVNQAFEFTNKVRAFLERNSAPVNGAYLLDDGISAGCVELSHEVKSLSDNGAKVDIELKITARNGSLESLTKSLLSQFPQFKEKRDPVCKHSVKTT